MTAPNQGHGHVVPRADGVKARCGGPALCSICQREQATTAEDAQEVAADLRKLIDSAPAHIWLDLGESLEALTDEGTFRDLREVSWSEDNATGVGIKYVRAPVAVATSDAERAAFEAWWRTSDVKFDDLKPSNWLGWQARAATPNPDWNNQRQAEINDWFLSLPEGRQKALLDGGRWELAGAAFNAGRALPIDFKQATDQGGTAALPAGWKLTLVGNRYVLQKPGEGSGVFDIEDSSVRVAVAAMFFRDLLAAAPTLLGVADGDAVGGKSGGQL